MNRQFMNLTERVKLFVAVQCMSKHLLRKRLRRRLLLAVHYCLFRATQTAKKEDSFRSPLGFAQVI